MWREPHSYKLHKIGLSLGSPFSSDLAAMIVVCNFIKLRMEIYIFVLRRLRPSARLWTMRLLRFPFEDTQTCDTCFLSINEAGNGLRNPPIGQQPRLYLLSRPRWANAISKGRWTLGLAILVVAILLVAILYAIADKTGYGSKGFDASARDMLWA
jgi:hypothetical protein